MTNSAVQIGDTVHAWMHDRSGDKVHAAVVAVNVVRLGCGCDRIEAHRPGVGTLSEWVNLRTGCGWHERQITDAAGVES